MALVCTLGLMETILKVNFTTAKKTDTAFSSLKVEISLKVFTRKTNGLVQEFTLMKMALKTLVFGTGSD